MKATSESNFAQIANSEIDFAGRQLAKAYSAQVDGTEPFYGPIEFDDSMYRTIEFDGKRYQITVSVTVAEIDA